VISLEDIFAIYARLSISLPCDSIRDLIIATWIRPNRPVRRLLSRAAESSSNACTISRPVAHEVITFHPSRSSRCLLVRNSSTDGTIKLAVEIGRDQLRRPAAGTQTESQFAAERGFGNPQIVFHFAKKLSQTSRRVSRGREHFSRGGANFFRNYCD